MLSKERWRGKRKQANPFAPDSSLSRISSRIPPFNPLGEEAIENNIDSSVALSLRFVRVERKE